jgi:hypothetical protein
MDDINGAFTEVKNCFGKLADGADTAVRKKLKKPELSRQPAVPRNIQLWGG